MDNTPTGCGSDLPTNLTILKKSRKSRSVNNSLQPLDLDPNRINDFVYQSKLRPGDVQIFIPPLCGWATSFRPHEGCL
jgi:hypothetical protein